MSVEKGVVISGFQKDYELQSWNEQGEITKIEGMLTIAFLVVSPCSHIDNRKQLYLIMEIPYMVDMSYSSKKQFHVVNFNEYAELKNEVPKLKQKIKELESKLDKLNSFLKEVNSVIFHKTGGHACGIGPIETAHRLLERDKERDEQICQFENEIKKIKDENIGLKELLGKNTSGWEIIGDVAVGINPFTKEKEHFGFPRDFDENKSRNIHFTDENYYMCHFKYFYDDERPWPSGLSVEYDMPITLYKHLCNISKLSKQKTFDIHELQNEENIKDYILFKGGNLRGTYPIKVIKFINNTRGKSFDIHEFDKYCGFKDNRESRRQYIKKLIEWGLIKPTENQRIYQNLI